MYSDLYKIHMEMSLAVRIAIIGSGIFLLVGMSTGIWKYWQIRQSEKARAHYYVDIAHRASLLYASASLILAVLAYFSVWSDALNLVFILGNLIFFAAAIFSYIVHGALKDTTNQLQVPHRVAQWTLPSILMTLFMSALIIAELGCTLALVLGASIALLM